MCAKRVLLKFMTSAYMLMIKHQYSVFALILLNQLYHGAYADIEPQPNYDDVTSPTVSFFLLFKVVLFFTLVKFRISVTSLTPPVILHQTLT